MTLSSSANNKHCRLYSFLPQLKILCGDLLFRFLAFRMYGIEKSRSPPKNLLLWVGRMSSNESRYSWSRRAGIYTYVDKLQLQENEKLAFSISSSPSQPGGQPGLPQQLPDRQGSPDLPQASSHRGWPWGRWSPSWSRKRLSWCGWPRAKAIAFIVKELQFHNSAVKSLCLRVACWP